MKLPLKKYLLAIFFKALIIIFLLSSLESAETKCRICESDTTFYFEKLIRGKYIGKYFLCSACGSLQLVDPIWLDEVYSLTTTFTSDDPGRFERIKLVSSFIKNLKQRLHIRKKLNILDYGAGEGILKKISPDNVTNYDPYFAYSSLEELKETKYDLIVCIEVMEHLENAKRFFQDLKELIGPNTIILCTTELINPNNIDPSWHYFIYHIGTHITFWTEKSFTYMKNYLNYKNVSHCKDQFLSFHLLYN